MPTIDPRLLYYPESIATQQQIDYQRGLAQMMLQKGMTPDQGGVAGQVYVGPSITQGLARMLNMYQGNKTMQSANAQERQLNIDQAMRIAALMNQGQDQQPQTRGPMPPVDYSLAAGPSQNLQQPPQQATQAPQGSRYDNIPANLSFKAMADIPGYSDAVKAWVSDQQMTPEMKNQRDSVTGPAARAAAWAPTYLAGGAIRLGDNGQASVVPAFEQAKDIEQRVAGQQKLTDINLPTGAKVQMTANEMEDYTRTGIVPKRIASDPVAMQGLGISQSPEALKFKEGRAANASEYDKNLNARVEEGHASMLQLGEQAEALKSIRTGGGRESYMKLATIAQAMGMPDKIINGIAGGDYASAQEFQKLSALSVLTQLRAAMQGQGKVNRNEFEVFLKNSANIETDPRAIEKLFAVRQRAYARDVLEQGTWNQYLDNGGDPAKFPTVWSSQIAPGGRQAPPTQQSPAPVVTPKPAGVDPNAIAAELARRQRSGATGSW